MTLQLGYADTFAKLVESGFPLQHIVEVDLDNTKESGTIKKDVASKFPFVITRKHEATLLRIMFASKITLKAAVDPTTLMLSPKMAGTLSPVVYVTIDNPLTHTAPLSSFNIVYRDIITTGSAASTVVKDVKNVTYLSTDIGFNELQSTLVSELLRRFFAKTLNLINSTVKTCAESPTMLFYGFPPFDTTQTLNMQHVISTALTSSQKTVKPTSSWHSVLFGTSVEKDVWKSVLDVLQDDGVKQTGTAKKQMVLSMSDSVNADSYDIGGPDIMLLTVEEIVTLLAKKVVTVPLYQREIAWKTADSAQFIGTMLTSPENVITDFITIGVVGDVDGKFVSDPDKADEVGGSQMLLNGLQRVNAIISFMNNEFAITPDNLTFVSEEAKSQIRLFMQADGMQSTIRYNQLSAADKRYFLSRKLPVCVRYGSNTNLSLYFVFLNKGKPLMPNESLFTPALFGMYFEPLKTLISTNPYLNEIFKPSAKNNKSTRHVEFGTLCLLCALHDVYTGSPIRDFTALSAVLSTKQSDTEVSDTIAFIENLLNFVFEVDMDNRHFVNPHFKFNVLYRMQSPVTGQITSKPVFFIRFAAVLHKVLHAYSEATGTNISAAWSTSLPWLYEQRSKMADIVSSVVCNQIKDTNLHIVDPSLPKESLSDIERDALLALPNVNIPIETAEQYELFLEHLSPTPIPSFSSYMPYTHINGSLVFEPDVAVTVAAEMSDMMSLYSYGSVDERNCLALLQNVFAKVSVNTNGVLVHTALDVYLTWFLFNILKNNK